MGYCYDNLLSSGRVCSNLHPVSWISLSPWFDVSPGQFAFPGGARRVPGATSWSELRPAFDFASAEDESSDAQSESLPGIPWKVGDGGQFEYTCDPGALAVAETHFDALPQRQAPRLRDLIAQFRDHGRRRAKWEIKSEINLLLGHVRQELAGARCTTRKEKGRQKA